MNTNMQVQMTPDDIAATCKGLAAALAKCFEPHEQAMGTSPLLYLGHLIDELIKYDEDIQLVVEQVAFALPDLPSDTIRRLVVMQALGYDGYLEFDRNGYFDD